MNMENELPKIDLPEDVLSGVLNDSTILDMYMNFPCRIKAEIFVLCKKGSIDASINLVDYHVEDNSFLIVLPGSILQVKKIEGEVEVYFAGFSSDFLKSVTPMKSLLDLSYSVRHNPVVSIKPEIADLTEEYFRLATKTKESFPLNDRNITRHLYYSLVYALIPLYGKHKVDLEVLSTAERITQEFGQLVLDHYTKEKNVAFYATKLSITPAYLSTVVKQVTGKTCIEIISNMIIMDAKAQLKSTNLPVYQIADALNFDNVSFFGKFFKRHVGISPIEFRNSREEE